MVSSGVLWLMPSHPTHELRTATLYYAETISYPQPPRDTGSILGVVEVPPLTVFRYEFVSLEGEHFQMAVGAQKGKVSNEYLHVAAFVMFLSK